MNAVQTQMFAIDHDVESKKEAESVLRTHEWRQVGTNRSERINGTKLSSLARTLGMQPSEINKPDVYWTQEQSTFEDPKSGNTVDVIDLDAHEQRVEPIRFFSGPTRNFSSLGLGSGWNLWHDPLFVVRINNPSMDSFGELKRVFSVELIRIAVLAKLQHKHKLFEKIVTNHQRLNPSLPKDFVTNEVSRALGSIGTTATMLTDDSPAQLVTDKSGVELRNEIRRSVRRRGAPRIFR